MAGTFQLGTRAIRPGSYFRRERAGVTTEGSVNGVIACLYKSNWGALNEVFDFDQTMLNEVADYAGDGADIIREALLGGATTVRAVRVGDSDGTGSTITIKTADSTPKDAVKITAKYPGNRAFSIRIGDDLITGDRQVQILDGTAIFQQFTFTAGGDEAAALVEAMANNRYFVAEKKNSGALADVTQSAFTVGTNPTVDNNSYSAGTNVLERYRWNVIIADSDDHGVHGMLFNFVKQSYETGHLGMACIAGKSSEPFDSTSTTTPGRIQQAAAYNDEKVVYVLNGWKSITGVEYDGWLAAARIGGMIAASETNTSVTHDVIQSAVELLEPLTNGEIIRAETKGCLVLSLNDEDQIWIDNAITTLVTLNANMDEGWKKIRRTKCRFELIDRINRTHDKLIGNINNDDNGRATIIAAAQKVINEMAGEAKLMPQSYVELDEAHPPEGDSVYLKLYILDIDSAEKIYNSFVFKFSQTFDEEE